MRGACCSFLASCPTLSPFRSLSVSSALLFNPNTRQITPLMSQIKFGKGCHVILPPQPTATSAVSFTVKAQKAVGGVMITASHNPPAFNGFKVLNQGRKLTRLV